MVVSNRNIKVAVTIEVSKFTRIAGAKVGTQRPGHVESSTRLVQKQNVLLWPVSSICDHQIHVAIAIDITGANRSRQARLCSQQKTTVRKKLSLLSIRELGDAACTNKQNANKP